MQYRLAIFGLLAATLIPAPGWSQTEPKPIDPAHAKRMQEGLGVFKTTVRKVLSERCLKCHGGQWVKGDFSLATRNVLMESGMVEKTAEDSHLMLLLRHEEEPKMPKDAPALKAEEIAAIAKWIDLGAPYDKPLAGGAAKGPMKVTAADREFWSFQSLQAELPKDAPATDEPWLRGEIDRYVLHGLRKAGLAPSAEAAKQTLIRRAYFDLLGLPPSPEATREFLADETPGAYERLLDRLLESPQYGERWARHWMDVARFAESHGYEQDYNRPHAYHYRDFLIRAFNADMPYDQFVQWQLAGDELSPDNPQALMATGFLGAGVFPTQLTEAEFESARYDELDDMTTTTGVAFLGLSVGCARCHDHKFDPIPSRDYYRLAATFTTTIRSELDLELDPLGNEKAKREHQEQLAARKAELAAWVAQPRDEAFAAWVGTLAPKGGASSADWTTLDGTMVSTAGVWKRQADGAYLADYKAPEKEIISLTTNVTSLNAGTIRAIRLEALTDPSFPGRGPGRAPNGNFALGHVRLRWKRDGEDWRVLKMAAARATHQQNSGELSVAASFDNDKISGWAVDRGGIGKDHAAVFDLASDQAVADGDRIELTLTFQHPNRFHTMGKIRVSTSSQANQAPAVGQSALPAQTRAAAKRFVGGKASATDIKALRKMFQQHDPKRAKLVAAIAKLEKEGPQMARSKVQVSSEGVPHMKHHADGRGYPHFYPETYFLSRGDVEQKQEPVESGFLQVLTQNGQDAEARRLSPPENSKLSYRRATLAKWITDPKHGAGHLAARVVVNRLWHHHFGRGLVATPNDFGFQGAKPTHPELLDYLASDLIRNGWKLKRVHKQIMMSAVYRQASAYRANAAKQDPDNRLLWRRARRRLEAEAIRDSMLAVSGELDLKMYGPGTLDERMKRRSVYFLIKRSKLISPLMLFDWPEHLVSIGSRATTTIAPQALMFMNSSQGRQAAEGFARRLPKDREQAVSEAYWLAFSRAPTAAETKGAQAFLGSQSQAYLRASRLAPDAAKQRTRVDFCQALLGANEFVYVD